MTQAENGKSPAPGFFENGLSYVSRPGPPLRPLTLGQLVDEAAKEWKDRECLYDVPMNTRLSFGQLKKEVDLFASGLLEIGLRKGERLGILGGNSCRWIITFLAAAKIGVIVVPLNFGYEAAELLYALNYMSIKCLVLGEPVKTRNLYGILKEAVPDMEISNESKGHLNPIPELTSTVAPHLKQIVYMGNERLDGAGLWTEVQTKGKDAEALEKMQKVAETVQFDDILHTPFTSGTTGRPKGVMISHFSQLNAVFGVQKCRSLNSEDRHCLTLPLCHLYGLYIGILYSMCFGSSVVIPSPTFSPSTAIKIAAEEKCTWLHGTPTMHGDMMSVPGFDLLDLSSLKAASIGAAASAKALMAQMKQKYGISRIGTGYASTESGCVAIFRVEGDPPELVYTSVGYPFENVEIKIIDAQGRIVGVGETGEICSRSPFVMQGYWEEPEKTREVIDSARWFHSGDAGYFLESGHLVLVGRFTDMLIRGGANIYPKEIEDFLYQNLSAEIEEVHVFGVADERLGEVVAAWILPKSKQGVTMDTDYVKQFCEGKISRSKIPVYIKIVQSKADFPRTPVGKAQKNLMRQLYEKELGLNSAHA